MAFSVQVVLLLVAVGCLAVVSPWLAVCAVCVAVAAAVELRAQ